MYPRVFPCIPVYSRVSRYSRYSRYSRVFPGTPGITVYSRVFPCIPVYSLYEARPARPLSPEAHSRPARGDAGRAGGRCSGLRGGVPGGVPHGHTPYPLGGMGYAHGVHHPVTPPRSTLHRPPARPAAPRAGLEWASGLNRPRGVRAGRGQGRHAPLTFPYLRSFWPGVRNRLQPVPDNRWIGSRSRLPRGSLDVSDLECLESGCASSRIRRLQETDPAM